MDHASFHEDTWLGVLEEGLLMGDPGIPFFRNEGI